MSKINLILLTTLTSIGINQTILRAQIVIETDPITTVFGAKTISLLIEPERLNHFSVFTNVVRADFPDWLDDFTNPHNEGQGFDHQIAIGGGAGLDYFKSPSKNGLYFGVLNLFFKNEVSAEGLTREITTHNIIPRVGYRKFIFNSSHVYINPFIGLRYEYVTAGDRSFITKTYEPAGIQPFGTVHLGYKF